MESILDPLAAMQPALSLSNLGRLWPKESLKLLAFIQVMAAPVSKSQLKVLLPVVTLILGLTLFPPIKGVIISESLL
jgi:hypothetical protein